MQQADIIAAVNALNCPEAAQEYRVYQVWEDGKLTLQKGGSLLWQRNLHCIQPGVESLALPIDALANKYNGRHSYIFARDHDSAIKARQLILGD
jgi:hypothetical protein